MTNNSVYVYVLIGIFLQIIFELYGSRRDFTKICRLFSAAAVSINRLSPAKGMHKGDVTLNRGFSAQNSKMDVERRSKYKAVEPDNISVCF